MSANLKALNMLRDLARARTSLNGSTSIRLVKIGRRNRDTLLRALIPLYLLFRAESSLVLDSGDLRIFWRGRRLNTTSSILNRALRTHIGYARHVAGGWQITPNGVRYVEAAAGGAHGRVYGV